MQLNKTGNVILIGQYDKDPFITDEWPKIEAEARQAFPGVDLVVFQTPHYIGLASLSESLDPMALAMKYMAHGILVMGSNKKVNIMTKVQLDTLLERFFDGNEARPQ